MGAQSDGEPHKIVSDHALVRYMERVFDLPVEHYRTLLAEEVRDAARAGVASLTRDGISYVFRRGVLVTVVLGKVNHGQAVGYAQFEGA